MAWKYFSGAMTPNTKILASIGIKKEIRRL
jgi:hypothetical protein